MAVAVYVESSTGSRPWLSTEVLDDDATLIRVRDGIAASRAEELWGAIEAALERAGGCRVIVDLTEVAGFDVGSIQELAQAAQASVRRHADLHAVLRCDSPLDQYVRCAGLTRVLPLHYSLAAALPDAGDLDLTDLTDLVA